MREFPEPVAGDPAGHISDYNADISDMESEGDAMVDDIPPVEFPKRDSPPVERDVTAKEEDNIPDDLEIMKEINEENAFECEFCEDRFADDGEYRTHVKTHLGGTRNGRGGTGVDHSPTCELCGKGLTKISRHLQSVHKVTKTLQRIKECLVCFLENAPTRLFYSQEGMQAHIKSCHETDEWKYCCNRCDSRLSNQNGLETHLESFHRIKNPGLADKLKKQKDGTYVLVDRVKT